MTDPSRLEILVEATQGLAATSDFSSTLQACLTSSARLAGARSAALALFNRTSQKWFVHSTLGDEAEACGDAALAAALNNQAVADAARLALPLQAKGRAVGAVCVAPGGLSANDRQCLEAFAASAGLAIDATLARTDFVSTVTHELRLPMTSIKGYSDLIRGGMAGPITDMQKQLLETVRGNVDWMNALVSDLSDIAKVETGRLKVDLESLAPGDCLRDAAAAQQPVFDARRQTLTVEAGALPAVRADRKRLVQMLTSLLTNANRYTPEGGQVRACAEAIDGRVRFTVTDTGAGVAAEDQARLFTPFFRSEDQAIRDHKGWGLALHLVKLLAGLFGGDVGAASDGPGQGSAFWFTLPIEESKS